MANAIEIILGIGLNIIIPVVLTYWGGGEKDDFYLYIVTMLVLNVYVGIFPTWVMVLGIGVISLIVYDSYRGGNDGGTHVKTMTIVHQHRASDYDKKKSGKVKAASQYKVPKNKRAARWRFYRHLTDRIKRGNDK